MKIEITKMHGLGNSYVIIEDFQRKLEPKYAKIAKFISNKSFGIGSDGILVVNKGKIAKYWMRVFNPDGSEAEMCGNGIRMFARYMYDKELISKQSEIEVGGSHGGRIVKPKITSNSTTVDMGKGSIFANKTLEVTGMKFSGVQVSAGNPHFVIFVANEKIAKENAQTYGSVIENHRAFKPSRTNVEFVYVKGRKDLIVHVWERGAGLTLACGTGASASAFASFKENKTNNKMNVKLPGGNLIVEIKNDDTIFMTGPAEYIFSASIDLGKL